MPRCRKPDLCGLHDISRAVAAAHAVLALYGCCPLLRLLRSDQAVHDDIRARRRQALQHAEADALRGACERHAML
jgi:hypothetical protein